MSFLLLVHAELESYIEQADTTPYDNFSETAPTAYGAAQQGWSLT